MMNRYAHSRGTILGKSLVLSSNQSTTLLRSVTLTKPTANPFSLACFMYSAPDASRRSHARYTAPREKKSCGFFVGSVETEEVEEVPGLRRRVGVDLSKVTVGERTMLDAREREGVVSVSFVVYVILAPLLIARRRARRASEEEAMFKVNVL